MIFFLFSQQDGGESPCSGCLSDEVGAVGGVQEAKLWAHFRQWAFQVASLSVGWASVEHQFSIISSLFLHSMNNLGYEKSAQSYLA